MDLIAYIQDKQKWDLSVGTTEIRTIEKVINWIKEYKKENE